jgi:hypothetical protein
LATFGIHDLVPRTKSSTNPFFIYDSFHTCRVFQPLFAMAYWAMRKELRDELDATGHDLKNAVWALFSSC